MSTAELVAYTYGRLVAERNGPATPTDQLIFPQVPEAQREDLVKCRTRLGQKAWEYWLARGMRDLWGSSWQNAPTR